jgi:hypothetical protein
MASGGMTTLTREPFDKRASTIGDDSSTWRPTAETILSMMCMRCSLLWNLALVLFDQSLALYVDRGMSIDENVVHGVVIDERL